MRHVKHRAGVEQDGVGWEALFMLSGGCEASQLLLAHHPAVLWQLRQGMRCPPSSQPPF